MVDSWFFWVSPKGKIVEARLKDGAVEEHLEVLYRIGVDELEAYNLGWVRVGINVIEGTPEAIEKHKELILDEMGYPDTVTVDFHTGTGIIDVVTGYAEMLENSMTRLATSAIAGKTFVRPYRRRVR